MCFGLLIDELIAEDTIIIVRKNCKYVVDTRVHLYGCVESHLNDAIIGSSVAAAAAAACSGMQSLTSSITSPISSDSRRLRHYGEWS